MPFQIRRNRTVLTQVYKTRGAADVALEEAIENDLPEETRSIIRTHQDEDAVTRTLAEIAAKYEIIEVDTPIKPASTRPRRQPVNVPDSDGIVTYPEDGEQ